MQALLDLLILANRMISLLTDLPAALTIAMFLILGAVVGYVIVRFVIHSSLDTAASKSSLGKWGLVIQAGTALLFAAFVVAVVFFKCQQIEMVRPSETWWYGRIFYHLILIGLLVAATSTDFREYIILDRITVVGTLIGLLGASFSGQLQLVHLWIDWNQVDTVVNGRIEHWGAYIPTWFDESRHWHGLAWSSVGAATGAGTIWLIRFVASQMLGREALGFGDVMLMGMIGSFLGWQPVCFVFLLAPLCGVVVGLSVRMIAGQTFVPFGPFLSLATVLVLFGWRWLWKPTREVFGHATTLVLLGAISLTVLVLLLGLLRVYHWIPVSGRRQTNGESSEKDQPKISQRSG